MQLVVGLHPARECKQLMKLKRRAEGKWPGPFYGNWLQSRSRFAISSGETGCCKDVAIARVAF